VLYPAELRALNLLPPMRLQTTSGALLSSFYHVLQNKPPAGTQGKSLLTAIATNKTPEETQANGNQFRMVAYHPMTLKTVMDTTVGLKL